MKYISVKSILQEIKMKRIIVMMAIIMLFCCTIFGCHAKREFVNNSYISSFPKVKVNIDPEFSHWGTYNYVSSGSDYYEPTSSNKVNIQMELTLLVPSTIGVSRKYNKGVIIYVHQLLNQGWFYVGSALSASAKNVFNNGVIQIGGHQYEYATRLFSSNVYQIYEQALQAGLVMPGLLLMKSYAKTYGENVRIYINYFEDIANSGIPYDRWFDKTRLVEAQYKYIEEFEKRASTAFALIQ